MLRILAPLVSLGLIIGVLCLDDYPVTQKVSAGLLAMTFIWLFLRNQALGAACGQALERVAALTLEDASLGVKPPEVMWRYEKLDALTDDYYGMLLKFWRPANSFFRDQDFLKPMAELRQRAMAERLLQHPETIDTLRERLESNDVSDWN